MCKHCSICACEGKLYPFKGGFLCKECLGIIRDLAMTEQIFGPSAPSTQHQIHESNCTDSLYPDLKSTPDPAKRPDLL